MEYVILQKLLQYVDAQGGRTIGVNYRLVHPFMQFGEGDLLCEFNDRIIAIECKFMGQEHGKAARTRRNKRRRKMTEQAFFHAAFAKLRFPAMFVRGAVLTDEGGYIICDDIGVEEAGRIVLRRLAHVDYGLIPRVSLRALIGIVKQIPHYIIDECDKDSPGKK